MTVSIASTPESGGVRPRVRLDVTTTDSAPSPVAAGALVSVLRVDPDGRRRPVLTEAGARLSAGLWTGYDYHAPVNVPVSYVAVFGDVQAESAPASGYWEYAPPPNLLPSSVAACGRAGDPTVYGWGTYGAPPVALLGAVVASASSPGLGLRVRVATPPAVQGLTGTLSVRLKTSRAAGVVYATLSRDDGVIVLGTGTSSATGAYQTITGSGTCSGDWLTLLVSWPGAVAGDTLSVSGVMLEAGGTAHAIPDPVWIDTTPAGAMVVSDRSWLMHPTVPLLSVALDRVASVADRTADTSTAAFWPVGATYPTVLGEGTRRASSGQLVVRADSPASASALDDLLADGGPILANLVGQPGWWDLTWAWLQPGQTTWTNRGGTTAFPARELTIPYQVIDTPAGVVTPLWTCDDVVATYATGNDVVAAYATGLDLVTDTRAA